MMSKSVSRNYLYNVGYQLLALLTPLFTTPYLARVLGADGVGAYSYTFSLATYFVLLASLCAGEFGARAVAYCQEDARRRSLIFYEVWVLRVGLTTISLFFYYLLILRDGVWTKLYWVQALHVLAVAVDVTWFFQGMEAFGRLVFRNSVMRVLQVVLVFLLVRQAEDLVAYAMLVGGVAFASGLLLWADLPRCLVWVPWREWRPFRDMGTVFQLFLPQAAISVYVVLDKTMLGVLGGSMVESGWYSQADKMVHLSITVLTAMGTVMAPRIAAAFAAGDEQSVRAGIMRSYRFVWFLGLPMMFGWIAIAENVTPWFLGAGYEGVPILLWMLAGLVVLIGLSNVTGIQYLVPTGAQNLLTLTVAAGALVNFGVNRLLIPVWGAKGAALATLISEMVVTGAQLFAVRDVFSMGAIWRSSVIYWQASLIMFFLTAGLGYCLPATMQGTACIILFGAGIYGTVLFRRREWFSKRIVISVCRLLRRK